MKKIILLVFCAVLAFLVLRKLLKPPPFLDEVKAFQQKDKLNPPPQNAVLFVGSSSITNWNDINDSFPGITVIGRGIGGASYPDIIRFSKEIILAYSPKKVVIYCGDNDYFYYEKMTPEKLLQNFKKLFNIIRGALPNTLIVNISIKPSAFGWKYEDKMIASNKLVKEFLASQSNTGFVDIHNSMLAADGKPDSSFYASDGLHLNAKGYALWRDAVLPFINK